MGVAARELRGKACARVLAGDSPRRKSIAREGGCSLRWSRPRVMVVGCVDGEKRDTNLGLGLGLRIR